MPKRHSTKRRRSLRQARSSQPVYQSRTLFRVAIRHSFLQLRNASGGIELTNARYRRFRSMHGSNKSAARSDNKECWAKVGHIPQAVFHKGQCLIIATGDKMCIGNPEMAAPVV